MKGQKLFLKIYIPFVIVIIFALIVLQILGSKTRVGYLTDFELNNFYEITNSDNTISTNYLYHFKIGYYDKVFRNSDIYGVYPDLSNLPDYIKEAKMDTGGSPFGNFVSSKIIEEDRIDNIEYILKIKFSIISIFILVLLILIIYLYNNIHKYIVDTNTYKIINNFLTEKGFIILIIIIGFLLFIFQFWLGFPGYFQNVDNYLIMDQSINGITNNVHPIIIALSLRFLYILFGYHSYYIFLINLVCWYFGLCLLINSLYILFNRKIVIFLFSLSYIGNIFFQNFFQLKDVTTSMYLWLVSSVMFFITVTSIKKIYVKIFMYFICILLLLLAMLWRHNAIVSVYPLFIFIVYILLNNKSYISIKKYMTVFITFMIIIAFALIVILKSFPLIILHNKDNIDFPTDMIYMLDIVACAVLADDYKLIPDYWYINNSNFDDIKDKYNKNPLWIDYMLVNIQPRNDVKEKWKEAVLKYPFYYLKQKWLMFNGYTTGFVGYIYNSSLISGISDYHDSDFLILKNINDRVLPYFDNNEKSIQFSSIRKNVYDILFNHLIQIKHIFFFVISLIIFLVSLYIIILKNEYLSKMLILSFSLSFSSLATTLIVVFVTISCDVRYIYPIIPTSLISLISFLAFIYCRGGFIKFIKWLIVGKNEKVKNNFR